MTPAPRSRPSAHLHSCSGCDQTYEDNCPNQEANSRCNPCVSGIPSVYLIGRRPIECCQTASRIATKDEIKSYRLAGDRPWFLCATCKRPFGYDPGRELT